MQLFKNRNLSVIKTLAVYYLSVFVFYTLSRIIFVILNFDYLSPVSFKNFFEILLFGFRFDLVAISVINATFGILILLPLKFFQKPVFNKVLKIIFIISNIFGLVFNFIDIIYFRFTYKRTTADIFNYLGVGGDFNKLIPQFIKDFWYVIIIFILLLIVFIKFINSFSLVYKRGSSVTGKMLNIVYLIVFIGLSILGIRGGLQMKPLDIIDAGRYVESRHISAVLNTPFTIIKTIGLPVLKKVKYFDDESELNKVLSTVKNYNSDNKTPFKSLNVVIIILEGFSQEHIGSLCNIEGYSGFTPYLDTIISKSYVFEGFSNGKRSIEGIPAVVAGIPSLMNEAFITSVYAGNKFESLAGLLKNKGYKTMFFHGGSNGTMGFNSFTKSAGFDYYYGRNEYNNESDYDGKWGIFDEPFLKYSAKVLNKQSQPFFATIFTLSSHHPYKVPEKYKGKFKKGKLEIQEAIMYTDYSLKQFFNSVENEPWFENTLFVITADHTSEAYIEFYKNSVGMYKIPIIYYCPKYLKPYRSNVISQQIDIMPSILDFLGYNLPFFSFGTSSFNQNEPHFAISFLNNEYQIIYNNFALKFDGKKSTSLFDYKNDPLLKNNLINKDLYAKDSVELLLKAFIQHYNTSLIDNKMTLKKQ